MKRINLLFDVIVFSILLSACGYSNATVKTGEVQATVRPARIVTTEKNKTWILLSIINSPLKKNS